MDNIGENRLGGEEIIDDSDHEKGRFLLQERLQHDICYDPKRGGATFLYRGGSGDKVGVTMEPGGNRLSVEATDTYNHDYGYESQLIDGFLYQDAALKAVTWEDELIRSPLMPHFNFLVDLSMKYFTEQGKSIQGMVGNWVSRRDDRQPSVNWNIYKKGLSEGLSSQEAALITPTGKAAGRHGFTEAVVTLHEPDPEDPLARSIVSVQFTKPNLIAE
ncbi:hypothetical protein BH09PAT1_BH09PAT1_4960 [soil metagenome]